MSGQQAKRMEQLVPITIDRSIVHWSETVLRISGHVTTFRPMRIQHFCW